MGRRHWTALRLTTLAVILGAPAGTAAQEAPADPAPVEAAPAEELTPIEDTALEDLLDLETTVATGTGRTLRESPAIVTIITRDEIIASGARDLVDVLLLVPGFHVAHDVSGVLGVGIRGLWAHEGKVLLLLDGQELNERLYSNVPLGNHIPVEHIARIEILRGPGSANYGGYAELGVINIITRGAELAGGAGGLTVGGMEGPDAWRRVQSFAYGGKIAGGAELSFSFTGGDAVRGDGVLETFYGERYRFDSRTAATKPLLANVGLRYEGLRLRYVYDGYRTTQRSAYGDELTPVPVPTDFPGHYLAAAYALELLDAALVITPHLSFKDVRPWNQPVHIDPGAYPSSGYSFTSLTSRRWLGGVTASYAVLQGYLGEHDLTIQAGVEGSLDEAFVDDPGLTDFGFGDDLSRYVAYGNFAAFAQALWQNPWVDVTAGARFEWNSAYEPSFVPRLGLTRVFGDFHAKALFGQGFRSPGVLQIESGILGDPYVDPEATGGLRPESATVFEGELGYRPFDFLFASVNYFEMWIDSPIIYTFVAELESEFYYNERTSGSRGVEADIKVRLPFLDVSATYSFYMVSQNTVAPYRVAGDNRLLVGFPAHKGTINATCKPGAWWAPLAGLTVNASAVGMSERATFLGVDDDDNTLPGYLAPILLLNLYVRYQPSFLQGLGVAAGVFNLLDEDLRFPQAYDGYHPAVPGPSREWLVRLDYRLGFD